MLKNVSSASQYFSGQCSSCPANTPAPITHFFALHRVRQLKRMVSTIATFVWWPWTCLQLVLRPPPPLSGGHCCICFSTQKYRVSQKLTYRSVASSLQNSFLHKDFAKRNSFGDCQSSRNTGETPPKQLFWQGVTMIKSLEFEGQVRSYLHFEGFTWGLAVVSVPSSSIWNRYWLV